MKCLLLALATCFTASFASAADKPNILVILADDLGWGELGCQGFTQQVPTPHIDSLATNGTRFTSGYVSGPYCSPTRAGFMTARYQTRYGHEFNPGPAEAAVENFGLSLKEMTIGDRFKAAGYATGWFGKSHLGYKPAFQPQQRGFDEYLGFLGGAHDYFDAISDKNNPILRGTEPVNETGYTTEAFGYAAEDFIERNKDKPWFCYLPFNAVHSPLQATEKYMTRFAGISDQRRRSFCAMLSAMDDAVGGVLTKLRQHGLEDNTLIFFFSDNGGPTPSTTSANGPLHGFKAQTWEGGIRVPFLVQWKGHLPAGKVDDRPVIQLDIQPTALAAAGIEIKPEWKLDGVNLLPYIKGEKTGAPHEQLFWRFGQQIALRKGDWKLVKANGGSSKTEGAGKGSSEGAELYNLAQDIGETKNLAATNPEKFKELTDAWNAMNAEMMAPQWGPVNRGGKKGAKKKKGKGNKKQ